MHARLGLGAVAYRSYTLPRWRSLTGVHGDGVQGETATGWLKAKPRLRRLWVAGTHQPAIAALHDGPHPPGGCCAARFGSSTLTFTRWASPAATARLERCPCDNSHSGHRQAGGTWRRRHWLAGCVGHAHPRKTHAEGAMCRTTERRTTAGVSNRHVLH